MSWADGITGTGGRQDTGRRFSSEQGFHNWPSEGTALCRGEKDDLKSVKFSLWIADLHYLGGVDKRCKTVYSSYGWRWGFFLDD